MNKYAEQSNRDSTTFHREGTDSQNDPQDVLQTSEYYGGETNLPFVDSRNDRNPVTPSEEDMRSNQHKPRKLKRTRFPRSPNFPPFLGSRLQGKLPETENHLREMFPAPAISLRHSARTSRSKITTQNFTLCVQSGQILLYHNDEVIVDLTAPRKVRLAITDIVIYEGGTVSVTLGITEATHYPNIKTLTVYKGTEVYTLTPASRAAIFAEVAGDLFVHGDKAFYCLTQQFNALLDSELTRIASSKYTRIQVEFRRTSADYGSILTINGMAIIILTDAEVRAVASSQLLVYRDGALYFQQTLEERDALEVFPEVEQLFLLSPPAKFSSSIIQKYAQSSDDVLRGRGGVLYVHKATRTALFSREPSVNSEVERFLSNQFSRHEVAFSIKFETYVDDRSSVEVVILADGEVVLTLRAEEVVDQSVVPQHHFTYANSTVSISDGTRILHSIEGIRRITLHTSGNLTSHSFSSSQSIQGGGQFFACKGLGFYSEDATLNDQIGGALLVAEAFEVPVSLVP